MRKVIYLVSGLAIFGSALLSVHPAAAQDADVLPVSTQGDTPYEFDAGIIVSEYFTDNVFLTANNRRSDFVTVFAPWIGLSYREEDFRLNLEASAEIARFAEYSRENYEDYFFGAEAQYRINESVFTFGGVDYELGTETRQSPDFVTGITPTDFSELSGYFGIGGKLDDRGFRLGVNVIDLNYDDTPTALGVDVNNDDRDRQQIELGGRIGVTRTENGEIFLQGIYDTRDYDQHIDDQGYRRSSKGYQGALGFTGTIGPMRGEVLLGLMSQDYDDPRFGNTTVPDIGADLTMPLGERTELAGILDRSIEETTLNGSSGYVSTTGGLRLRHRVASDMSLAAYAFLTQNDYQEISRTDNIAETGLSLRYYFNPKFYLDTNYDFLQRQSNVAGADYDEHRISLSFGAALDSRFDYDTDDRAKVSGGSFYAGLQAGISALHTKVDGPRGGGGNLTADFGDHGAIGGIFGGYRSEYDALVLGLEAGAEFSDTSWKHAANRNFSVDRGNAYSFSALTGLRTPGGNLLYGRFGVVSTEFDSTYQRVGNPVVKLSEREMGLLVGVGAEIPLGNGLSGRMEYQLRAYDDYEIGSPLGTDDDNFANVESLAQFGLVYELGSKKRAAEPAVVTDFSGFYGGLQIGHGTLQSDNVGPRVSGSGVISTLDATRAGQGFTGGLFAGYGVQSSDFYIGGEAEVELNSAVWNIERSPNGRIYSIEKVGTIGAGLRVGYVLNDSVLLYGRAGLVRSKFNLDYSYNGNVVDQSKTLDGVRLGGGIEFAISDKMHARLDYTQTEYDSNSIDYNLGVDHFNTTGRLFRVGLTRQF